jgi:hypothetical protein
LAVAEVQQEAQGHWQKRERYRQDQRQAGRVAGRHDQGPQKAEDRASHDAGQQVQAYGLKRIVFSPVRRRTRLRADARMNLWSRGGFHHVAHRR